MNIRPADFVTANTDVLRPALTPEIALRLATESTPLWHATADELSDAGAEPPFWAFAWPGGQALARHVLDNPAMVAEKRVMDIATGSGLVAIAAAKAGAASVTANDIDPLSLAAVSLNAQLNGVAVTTIGNDLTCLPSTNDWDVILAGDVFYDREMAARFTPWLRDHAASGVVVMVGDPNRAYLPADDLERLNAYDVETSLDLESATMLTTTIWRFR
jgi:predicted nicotinamide N-methyase